MDSTPATSTDPAPSRKSSSKRKKTRARTAAAQAAAAASAAAADNTAAIQAAAAAESRAAAKDSTPSITLQQAQAAADAAISTAIAFDAVEAEAYAAYLATRKLRCKKTEDEAFKAFNLARDNACQAASAVAASEAAVKTATIAAAAEESIPEAPTPAQPQRIPGLMDQPITPPSRPRTAAPSKAPGLLQGATVPEPDETAPPTNNSTDQWTEVIIHHRRRSNSSSSSSSSRSVGLPIVTLQISGLPQDARTPKALQRLLLTIPGLVVSNLRVFSNGTAVISAPCHDLKKKLEQWLSPACGKPLSFSAPNSKPSRPPPKSPSFSCVLRGVDFDVTPEDVKSALSDAGIAFTDAWRIRSKATDQLTRLFRIVTASRESLDTLLTKGVCMFWHRYTAEVSHPPKPQPVQCGRCVGFDHTARNCPEEGPSCGLCGGEHVTAACKKDAEAAPRCINCDADGHTAFSAKCPKRPAEASSAATAAPLKTVDLPEPEILSCLSEPVVHATIRLVASSLANLFPDRRGQIDRVLRPLVQQLFGLQYAASYSGNWLHISLQD